MEGKTQDITQGRFSFLDHTIGCSWRKSSTQWEIYQKEMTKTDKADQNYNKLYETKWT
jgi:hypothetical protein